MRYIRQFGIILFISFLGEVLRFLVPFQAPASFYGLILMLLCLHFKVIRLEQVENVADFLIEIMPMVFLPSTVGLMACWDQLTSFWLPVVVICVSTTLWTMAVAGRVTQSIMRREKKEGGKDAD